MAEEYIAKQVEVTGQIICELIRKDILPKDLTKGGTMTVAELASVLGVLYQGIWKAIDAAPRLR